MATPLIDMQSGIMVYRSEQGEYCQFPIYDNKTIEHIFELIKRTSSPVVNMKISNSREEIRAI